MIIDVSPDDFKSMLKECEIRNSKVSNKRQGLKNNKRFFRFYKCNDARKNSLTWQELSAI